MEGRALADARAGFVATALRNRQTNYFTASEELLCFIYFVCHSIADILSTMNDKLFDKSLVKAKTYKSMNYYEAKCAGLDRQTCPAEF